jgi:hypothetical protein
MSIGIVAVYGLLSRTPKFLSPLSSRRINTPICIKPTRAAINRFLFLELQKYQFCLQLHINVILFNDAVLTAEVVQL